MNKIVVTGLLALAPLAGCTSGGGAVDTGSSPSATVTADDPGVAQCKQLAKTAASDSGGDDSVPTDEEFRDVRSRYEHSRYSDLKRAGISHLDAVKSYYDNPANTTLADILVKRRALEATCAKHGVVIQVRNYMEDPPPAPTTLPLMTYDPTQPVN